MSFPELHKSMVNKVAFVGFRGAIAPIAPLDPLLFVLHRSKISLVLTTKLTHLRSLLFRQQDKINSAVKRVYLAITTKLIPTE